MKNLHTIYDISSIPAREGYTYIRRRLLLTLLLGNDTTQFLLVPILHVVWLSVYCSR